MLGSGYSPWLDSGFPALLCDGARPCFVKPSVNLRLHPGQWEGGTWFPRLGGCHPVAAQGSPWYEINRHSISEFCGLQLDPNQPA